MRRLIFDMESNGFVENMTVVHSLVLRDVDTEEVFSCTNHKYTPENESVTVLSIEDGLKMLMEADEIIGHNIIKFDIPAIQKIYPWFEIDENKVIDTLVISRLIWSDLKDRDFGFRAKNPKFPGHLIGRHSLESWGWRFGLHKGDYSKEMKALGLDPWAEWNPSMQSYCEQDVLVTRKFWELITSKRYSQESIKLEHDFQHVIFKQELFGFPFHEKNAQKLYATLAQRRLELETSLQETFKPWFARGAKTSPKRSMKRFIPNVHGVHIRKKDGVKGYYEHTTEDVEYYKVTLTTFNPGSRNHIENRLVKLRGWKPRLFGKDGKATVNDEVIQSLKYPEAKLLSEYLMIQKRIGQLAEGAGACLKLVKDDGRIHGNVITNGAVTGRCTHNRPNVAQTPAIGVPYGADFRGLYYAPKGWSLVGADASGLELRCLAHFMARYDGGAYGKEILEGDIHTANQLAAGLPTRPNAKTFIYAFLYGAGDEKIGQIVGKGSTEGRKLKNRFLKKTPALKRLRDAIKQTVKKKGYLVGLDGRLLHIRSQHSAMNTLFQSAGALVMKKATVLFYQYVSTKGYVFGEDYALVAHVHDEMQVLARDEIADEIGELLVKSIREAGEHFGFRCPLDGEYKVGRSWAETH